MLSGSTTVRAVILLVAAAGLAGIVQYLLPREGAPEQPPANQSREPAPKKPETRRSDPAKTEGSQTTQGQTTQGKATTGPDVRVIEGAGLPPAPPPELRVEPPAGQEPAPTQPVPNPAPDDAPLTEQPVADAQTAPEPVAPQPADGELVDINTGTLAQLNGLRGGGLIGRAIIQRRPYGSIEDLVAKRVLSRAAYERIKNQVTVR